MSHELFRLKSKIHNTPHLITEDSFNSITSYLNDRNNGLVEIRSLTDSDDKEEQTRYNYNKDFQVATMNVEGVITYKPITFMGMDCGGFSYEQWKEDFVYLAEQGVKTVALLIDSGGGEAYGCFDSAKYVREVADAHGITILSYIDGSACSAAYAIASISDEIIMGNGAKAGSIGVLISLINDDKALKKEGYERTFITHGGSKVPWDKDGEFSESFLQDLQDKVNILGERFVEFVATNRNISASEVKSMEAKTFFPEDAIKLGLADEVMTPEEFYTYLAIQAEEHTMKKTLFGKSMSKETTSVELSALQQEAATLQQDKVELSAKLEKTVAEMSELKAALEVQKTQLSDALDIISLMEEEKVEAKAQARKDKLASVLAADKVDSVAQALASLDDEAFEAVYASYQAQSVAEEESSLFQESGSSFEAEETVAQEDDSTTAAIKQRFGLK